MTKGVINKPNTTSSISISKNTETNPSISKTQALAALCSFLPSRGGGGCGVGFERPAEGLGNKALTYNPAPDSHDNNFLGQNAIDRAAVYSIIEHLRGLQDRITVNKHGDISVAAPDALTPLQVKKLLARDVTLLSKLRFSTFPIVAKRDVSVFKRLVDWLSPGDINIQRKEERGMQNAISKMIADLEHWNRDSVDNEDVVADRPLFHRGILADHVTSIGFRMLAELSEGLHAGAARDDETLVLKTSLPPSLADALVNHLLYPVLDHKGFENIAIDVVSSAEA